MNRSWMDRRVVNGATYVEYKEGVKNFYDYTFGNTTLLVERWARYPCNRRVNRKMHYRDTIIAHLYKSTFMRISKHQYAHGETWETVTLVKNHRQYKDVDRMVDMVMDVASPEFDQDMSDDLEPNSDNFFCMLKDGDEPLWPGYETHTILLAISKLLNLKAEFNMIVSCYDRMVQ